MGSLTQEIVAEKENVEETLNNLKDALARTSKSVIELSAIAAFLHNVYNGIENILKQTLKAKGIKIPKTETWHKDLLNTSASNGIISEKIADELYEYLTFRHFFIHAYGFMLDEKQLEGLTNDIPNIWSRFLSEIENSLS